MQTFVNDGNKKGIYLFTEQELNHIEKMASTGLGITDIAQFLCISDSNFRKHLHEAKTEAENFNGNAKRKNEYLDQNVYFRHSRGVQANKLLISKGLTEHAMRGNPQILMFLARTKLGWNDRVAADDQNQSDADLLSDISVNFVESEKLPEAKNED